jgi:hypothetical protein
MKELTDNYINSNIMLNKLQLLDDKIVTLCCIMDFNNQYLFEQIKQLHIELNVIIEQFKKDCIK